MSLTLIQQKILQPFVDETLFNLKAMAGMNGHTDPGFPDAVDKFRFKGYAICAETSGGIDGVMLMHHYVETAVAMGNAVRKHVLGDEQVFNEINEAMADALAEWGNTVLGRATRALGENHLNIKFEPPYFVFDTDTMTSLLTGVVDIITVPVHVENVGRFYFNYLIRSVSIELLNEVTNSAPCNASQTTSGKGYYIVDGQEKSLGIACDKKILIVDDMKMVRTSIKLYLKKLGFTNLIEAENGKIAVEKFQQEQPDFVFMDMVMPEMTGDEALQQMRSISTEVPIVILSSVSDSDVIAQCESLGATGYIVKPLTQETGPDILARFVTLK